MRVTNSTHTHTRIDRHPGWLLLRGLQDDGACGQLLCWHRQFAIAIHSPRGVVADALLLRPCALFHAYGISQALISVDITGQPLTPPMGRQGHLPAHPTETRRSRPAQTALPAPRFATAARRASSGRPHRPQRTGGGPPLTNRTPRSRPRALRVCQPALGGAAAGACPRPGVNASEDGDGDGSGKRRVATDWGAVHRPRTATAGPSRGRRRTYWTAADPTAAAAR